MNPVHLMIRVTGVAIIAAAAGTVLLRKFAPKPDDLVAGALHMRNGVEEFRKGFTTMFFGETEHAGEKIRKHKESTRIEIE